MLLYNWPKIFDVAKGNPNECIKIVKMMVEGTIPKNTYDPMYLYSTLNFAGDSFLLHPDVLFFYSYKYPVKDVAIYLSIASIRSLAAYLSEGTIHLPKELAPLDVLEHLEDPESGLIKEDSDNYYFLYEESPKITH